MTKSLLHLTLYLLFNLAFSQSQKTNHQTPKASSIAEIPVKLLTKGYYFRETPTTISGYYHNGKKTFNTVNAFSISPDGYATNLWVRDSIRPIDCRSYKKLKNTYEAGHKHLIRLVEEDRGCKARKEIYNLGVVRRTGSQIRIDFYSHHWDGYGRPIKDRPAYSYIGKIENDSTLFFFKFLNFYNLQSHDIAERFNFRATTSARALPPETKNTLDKLKDRFPGDFYEIKKQQLDSYPHIIKEQCPESLTGIQYQGYFFRQNLLDLKDKNTADATRLVYGTKTEDREIKMVSGLALYPNGYAKKLWLSGLDQIACRSNKYPKNTFDAAHANITASLVKGTIGTCDFVGQDMSGMGIVTVKNNKIRIRFFGPDWRKRTKKNYPMVVHEDYFGTILNPNTIHFDSHHDHYGPHIQKSKINLMYQFKSTPALMPITPTSQQKLNQLNWLYPMENTEQNSNNAPNTLEQR
ncbi:hypothetical protein [Sediminicola luteus]|uniref:Uncharacterized protein n=1 Tax=Sediminicola luteus TaxID=319238 RepID=A0A2A4GC53_9FLAO|nr:hypothetical protein [Sediminicola luteus]PCE65991.1 hypothetical protein B7P33_01430 [Sediminicola luteus]